MGFTTFISDHTLGIGIFIILLGLSWKFIIQPRLGMTDSEVRNKLEETMDGITDSVTIDSSDIIDESSMPKL